MRVVLTTVAVLAGVLALSACGSGQRAAFTKVAKVGALSVPTPPGFRSRTWPGGIVISDRAGRIPIPCTTNDGCTGGLAGYPSQDELVVYRTLFMETPPTLRLPLRLENLQQTSDSLTEWTGGGSIGRTDAYAVGVWLGPKAPMADRSAILSALQAIKAG
jgi:hypothetical protein